MRKRNLWGAVIFLLFVLFSFYAAVPKTNESDLSNKYSFNKSVPDTCFTAAIGIFSTQDDLDRENQFRRWLETNLSCGLRFLFVRGKGTGASPSEDTIVLDVAENMNEGKSIKWFDWACKNMPDADYIFKMDLDSGVCPKALLQFILSSIGSEYIGYPWRQRARLLSGKPCTLELCPTDEWFYMSGGFYGLRADLAMEISQAGLLKGHEDAIIGSLVHKYRPHASISELKCLHDCREGFEEACASHSCPVLHFMTNKTVGAQSSIC